MRKPGWRLVSSIILGILVAICSCGTEDKNEEEDTSTSEPVTWATASAIIKDSCALSTCHGGTWPPNFTDISEANFAQNKAEAKRRITEADGSSIMPPASDSVYEGAKDANSKFTADNKKLLLDYLGQ